MRIRTLGRSGLRVSELCLGTMTFGMPGWGCDEAESLRLVNQDQLDDTLAAAGTSVPQEVLSRLEEASAIRPEYPDAFIDTIQHWLGNR
jgi:hypothetical protein